MTALKIYRKFYIVDHQTTVRVLSAEARGIVEKYIDTMLSTIPPLVQYFCQEANQKDLQYKEPNNVVFGYVWRAVPFFLCYYPQVKLFSLHCSSVWYCILIQAIYLLIKIFVGGRRRRRRGDDGAIR